MPRPVSHLVGQSNRQARRAAWPRTARSVMAVTLRSGCPVLARCHCSRPPRRAAGWGPPGTGRRPDPCPQFMGRRPPPLIPPSPCHAVPCEMPGRRCNCGPCVRRDRSCQACCESAPHHKPVPALDIPAQRRETENNGGVAEWFKAPVLKTGERESAPWVRIPPPPPFSLAKTFSRSGPGRIFVLYPRVMRERL